MSQKWLGFYPLNNKGKKGWSTVRIFSLAHPKIWALAIKQPDPETSPGLGHLQAGEPFQNPHHTTQGTANFPNCRQGTPAPGSLRWKT